MKQKIVIKFSSEGDKSPNKALKIVVGLTGVESAALKGDDKSQIEVTGDGMDPVLLTTSLRKKFRYAELVSVGPAGGEKKAEEKPKETEVKVQPYQFWPYQGGVPHYDYHHVVTADRYPDTTCSIM